MEKIKMGIDKETIPTSIWVSIDNKEEYIKQLLKNSKETQDSKNQLLLTLDGHSFEPSEYYFEESDNEIVISGELISPNGKSYIGINIPLSDTLLIDILQHAINKLNKVKTFMECMNR
jgi:hypothetical protein